MGAADVEQFGEAMRRADSAPARARRYLEHGAMGAWLRDVKDGRGATGAMLSRWAAGVRESSRGGCAVRWARRLMGAAPNADEDEGAEVGEEREAAHEAERESEERDEYVARRR